MSQRGTAVLALISLIAVAGLLIGCNGFFVSPNSLATLKVTPDTAVLSSASGAGTLQLSATGTLVDGDDSTVSPNWTTSDSTGAEITISPTADSTTTTVTPTAGSGGTAYTVTASTGGQSTVVPIFVTSTTITSINVANLSATSVAPGSSFTLTIETNSGVPIPASCIDWTVPTGVTVSGNGNIATFQVATTVTALTTISITALINYNSGTFSVTTQSISVS